MKAIDFLKKAKVFYLATAEEDQPHVRPIGFVMEYEGKPAFYSDSRKKVYKQMKANPKVAFCAVDDKMNTMRVTGKVRWITSEETKKAALEAMPMLAKVGYSEKEGPFEIYTIDADTINCVSMKGEEIPVEW